MKYKANSTIALLLILVVLGGIAWWLISTQETAVNKKLVFTLPPSKIQGMNILRRNPDGGEEKIALCLNKDMKWEITEPIKDRGKSSIISDMVQVLEKIESDNIIKNAANLSDYGLENPVVTLEILLSDSQPVKLLIGTQSPIPDKYYAKFEKSPDVFVMNAYAHNTLNKDLYSLRENMIAEYPVDQVVEVEFNTKEKRKFRVIKNNGKWRMMEPYIEEILSARVDLIVDRTQKVWAQDFLDEKDGIKKYGLDKPLYKILLKLKDGQRISCAAKMINEEFYITCSQRQAIFKTGNPAEFDFLTFDPWEQTEKRLVEYEQQDVASLRYLDEGISGQTGKPGESAGIKLDGEKLGEVWSSLSEALFSGVYHAGPKSGKPVSRIDYHGKPPVCRMILTLKKGAELELVVFRHPQKQSHYLVTSNERSNVYEISAETIDNLRQKIRDAGKK